RGLHGPAQGSWLARLDAERPNLNALLAWSLGESAPVLSDADVRPETGARLVAALIPFWWRRGYTVRARAGWPPRSRRRAPASRRGQPCWRTPAAFPGTKANIPWPSRALRMRLC